MRIMRFGEKVNILMAQAGETQMSLGESLGVSQTSVGRWISGAKPRPKVVAKISAHFGVPIEILLDDKAVLPTQITQSISAVGTTGNVSSAGEQLAEKWRRLPESERAKIADKLIDCLTKNIKD
jgi:transcriptional regulator with XRE-family HTH domain